MTSALYRSLSKRKIKKNLWDQGVRSVVGPKNTRPFLAIQQQQQPSLLQVFRKIEKEIVT